MLTARRSTLLVLLALCCLLAAGRATAAPAAPASGSTPHPVTAPEPAGPWAAGFEAGVGLGFFFATHGKGGITLGRRFFRYLEVHAAFHFDASERLLGFEETLGAALVLPLRERWELAFAWRLGVATFRARMVTGLLWTSALTVSVIVEARYLLTRSWELRFAPVTATGYWDTIWGMVLAPSLGVALRF